jgi:hypothetical protein
MAKQLRESVVLPMLRLSYTQREFTHYAMAEQLREDFSFANVAIKPYAEGVYSLCYGRATKGKRSFANVAIMR